MMRVIRALRRVVTVTMVRLGEFVSCWSVALVQHSRGSREKGTRFHMLVSNCGAYYTLFTAHQSPAVMQEMWH